MPHLLPPHISFKYGVMKGWEREWKNHPIYNQVYIQRYMNKKGIGKGWVNQFIYNQLLIQRDINALKIASSVKCIYIYLGKYLQMKHPS
jgi:hypothetical protein